MIKKITYEYKIAIQNDETISRKNKVTDEDMNEIKDTINQNADELENIQNDISSIKQKDTAQDKKIKELQDENTEITAENQRLKSDINSISLTGQASGESIELNDSSNARFNKFEIGGNHKQETREGYNLYNYKDVQVGKKIDGNTGNIVDDYGFCFAGYIAVEENTKYIRSNVGTGTNLMMNKNKQSIGTTSGEAFTTPSGCAYVAFNIRREKYDDGSYLKFVMNEGTVLKPYEPYTGGKPAPNLDYPSEIKTVGGNVNLLDVDKTTYDTNINLQKEGKYLKGNDVNLIRIGTLNNSTPEIEERLEVGNYTVSYEIETNANITIQNLFLCAIYEDNTQENIGNGISYSIEKGIKAKVFWTIDVTKVAKKIGIVSYLSSSCDVILSNIKLEKGSKATSYSKNGQGSVEVKVVNNDNTQEQTITMPVQKEMLQGDYFDWDNEKEVHTWGKIILNGNEEFSLVDDGTNVRRFAINNLVSNVASGRNSICNYFINMKYNERYDIGYFYLDDWLVFGDNSNNFSNLEQWKQWLAQHQPKIYYKLAIPTELSFTEEQKEVAKQIKETLHTYKNVTHIYSTDETSPILNVEYAKDPNAQNSNLQNQIDEIKQLLSTTQTSAILLDNLQKEIESEVE